DNHNKLIAGADGSNSAGKFSYLDATGNIQSFTIPTIMAPTDGKGDPLKKTSEVSPTDRLHVRINSTSLQRTYYYVGEAARGKIDMVEPRTDGEGQTVENKSTSELHFVNILTGLATAAILRFKDKLDDNSNLTVEVPYYGGLPIEEFKEVGSEGFLNRIKGNHTIEFLDGLHQGITVNFIVKSGEIYIEGATTQMSLTNDIKDNEIIDIPGVAEKLEEGDYVVGDLGAGTLDIALFEHDGLNGTSSTNHSFGTNLYIDRMITDIAAHPKFEEVRTMLEEAGATVTSPYSNRDEFMKRVIKPVILEMLTTKDEKYKEKFTASWGLERDVDVTEIVLKHMKDYYEGAVKLLKQFSITKAQDARNFFLVGGGILFAYPYFKDIKYFQLPPKDIIKEAQYFTSRAYLIAAKLGELMAVDNNL
ncbi:MAG: hypothetical protein ACE3L7_33700, partial [Candidatus Pristimantibacillus sp.]